MSRFAVGLSLLLIGASTPQHFELTAAYEASKKAGVPGAVAVRFTALDPDVHVNETPAPRLKLATADVLVDKQTPPPDKLEAFDPESAKYLDLSLPVYFPVALAKTAPKGAQQVPVSVTYYYCSKRAGWCRKGTAELVVPVDVR
jgi:hypothetical protein